MPFLFEQIEDYTELLMPDDLLSGQSVLHTPRGDDRGCLPGCGGDRLALPVSTSPSRRTRSSRPEEEQEDQAEDIPAATQLFTPHWIVRYLVENSLGRLWMLNLPARSWSSRWTTTSSLSRRRRISCDRQAGRDQDLRPGLRLRPHADLRLRPALRHLRGTGLRPGRDPQPDPRHNLYGIEIDERAGDLAAFALTMKARAKDRRFFSRGIEPNICVLENIGFSPSELDAYKKKVGHDLFTQELWFLLGQFEQADYYGSLIQPRVKHPRQLLERLEELGAFNDLLLFSTNQKVKQVLKQAEYLSPRYHAVVTNPPYMGNRHMNPNLKEFVNSHYKKSKADLYTSFIEKGLELVHPRGYVAMITIPSWMFLSSFEKLRYSLLGQNTIICMSHNGRGVWGSDFGSCSFVLIKQPAPNFEGAYKRLFTKHVKVASNQTLIKRFHDHKNYPIFHATSADFKKIPGAPIAYWVSDNVRNIFSGGKLMGDIANPRQGLASSDNDRFL